ncbi:hypothetical protein N2152v2_007076 [Parachlorella kessleri]
MLSFTQDLDRGSNRAIISAEVPPDFKISVAYTRSELDFYLEKASRGENAGYPELIVNHVESGMELARVPLEAHCDFDSVDAKFNKKTRMLRVAVDLAPEASSIAAAAAHREPATLAPERQPAAETNGHSAPGTLSDSNSESSDAGYLSASEHPEANSVVSDRESPTPGEASPLGSPQQHLLSPDAVCCQVAEHAQQDAGAKPQEGGEGSTAGLGGEREQPPLESVAGAASGEHAEQPSFRIDGVGGGPEGSEAAAGAAKKKKKKKKSKKKKVGAAGAETTAEGGEGEGEVADEEALDDTNSIAAAAAGPEEAASSNSSPQEQQGQQQGGDTGEDAPDAEAGLEEEQSQADAVESLAAGAAAEKIAGDEGAPARPGGVWTPDPPAREWSPVSGPAVKEALAKEKSKGKGEDQWLVKPSNAWGLEGVPGEASFGAYGIFDGHGGRHVATFASNNLLKKVMARVNETQEGDDSEALQEVPHVEGLEEEQLAQWRLESTLVRRLPQACREGFLACDLEARAQWRKDGGGTTATLAFVVGWELLVASCGDSCAYLDTGTEVLLVSGNHRLDDNSSEQERVQQEGSSLAQSLADGKPVGPLRVWPGGLAMSRTIGDYEAGDPVGADPEICQVTIPAGGARLLIGSDGLWDAVQPKSAANHTREMPAGEAAHRLLALAIKKDALKDDVTIIVVDFLPEPTHRLPAAFTLHRASASGGGGAGATTLSRSGSARAGEGAAAGGGAVPHLAHVWHPLRHPADTPRSKAVADFVQRGAERRAEVVRQLEEAKVAEELAARERQQDDFRKLLRRATQEGAAAGDLQAAIQQGAPAPPSEAPGSGLYHELLNLRLSREELEAAFAAEHAEQAKQEEERRQREQELVGGQWETVVPDKVQKQPHHQHGPRRGRGLREPRRGREPYRHAGHARRPAHEDGPQHAQHAEQAAEGEPGHQEADAAVAAPEAEPGQGVASAGADAAAQRRRGGPREPGRGRGGGRHSTVDERLRRRQGYQPRHQQQGQGGAGSGEAPPGHEAVVASEAAAAAGGDGQHDAGRQHAQHAQRQPYGRERPRLERHPRGQWQQQQEGQQQQPGLEGAAGAPGFGIGADVGEGGDQQLPPRDFQRRRREVRGRPLGPPPQQAGQGSHGRGLGSQEQQGHAVGGSVTASGAGQQASAGHQAAGTAPSQAGGGNGVAAPGDAVARAMTGLRPSTGRPREGRGSHGDDGRENAGFQQSGGGGRAGRGPYYHPREGRGVPAGGQQAASAGGQQGDASQGGDPVFPYGGRGRGGRGSGGRGGRGY